MMIPITRKEKYINQIVGGGDTAPETPQTREEFFFAEILGEVIAPSPVTRTEKYLSAIVGQYSGDLPTPITRIEYFLAKAAGMEIETPIPITREEILWDTYIPIKTIEGIPPLTFKAKKAGTLKNYRIYGNTETETRSYSGAAPLSFPIVDGAVSNYRIYGQTSRNLFDETIYNKNVADNAIIYVPMYVGNVDYVTCSTTCPKTGDDVHDGNNSRYIFFISGSVDAGAQNAENGVSNGVPRTIPATNGYVTIAYRKIESYNVRPWEYQTMLNVGSTALPYEPYGESVGDRTNNILSMSAAPIDTIIDDFHCEYDGMGTIKLTALTDNAVLSGFTVPLSKDFTIPISVGQGGTGCLQLHNDAAYMNANGTASFYFNLMENTYTQDYWGLLFINRVASTYGRMAGTNINAVQIQTEPAAATNIKSGQTLTISPAFVENVTEQVPFEPYGYRIPITNNSETANIYLDEPLTKQGDNADYIDYAEQKRYNADGTSEDVSLPALPAQSTSNSLSVGTAVQPSSVAVDVDEIVSCGDKVTDSQSVNYGKYKIPVTLTAGSAETTDIYLDEPLAKSGNNADYIDYATQKRQNSDGTESTVILPEIAVTAGTNTLTVGTEVQPSEVYIKYEGER